MSSSKIYRATVTAPVNIATIKYWGKRDVALNLPTNSSISVTLSQDDLRTLTTASASESYAKDELWLNGKLDDVESSSRLKNLLKQLKELRAKEESRNAALPKLSKMALKVVSENNFPTAAGLASSASGYAALTAAVAALYELPQSVEELSLLARQGSGSACRSLMSGYVAWNMGSRADGSDSRAEQIAPREHWPEMRAAVLVVSALKKDTSSTQGMQLTVQTSTLFKERVASVVPQRMQEMTRAIRERNFELFATTTMKDSNSFHAVCLDTFPPITYLNDVSRAAIRVVEEINERASRVVAAYTFDAGPNAVIYYLHQDEALVLSPLKQIVGSVEGWEKHGHVVAASDFKPRHGSILSGGVERVILTSVGDGPQRSDEHLVGPAGEIVKT